MAVEKSKITARYKAIFGSVGLSATRLDAIAVKLAAKMADESNDDAIDAELNDLNEVYPFSEIKKNDDRTSNDKNNPNKRKEDDNVVEKKDEPKNEMEKLMQMVTGLTQTVSSLQQQNIGKTRKEQAASRLAKFPKEMKEDLLIDIDSMNFSDDEAFNSFIERKEETFKTIVDKGKLNAFNGEDAPPGSEASSEVKKGKVKEIDADLASKIVS